MPVQQKYQPLYDQFRLFIDRCLINDRSFLWPERALWTPENVRVVHDLYVYSPEVGKGLKFEDQLQIQLESMPPELWGIIADVYYVYFLPSNSITVSTKRDRAEWAAQNAGFHIPNDPALWDAQGAGFVTTGVKYNTKFKQFNFLIRMALKVKALSPADREKLFGDHSQLQSLLDTILEETGSGARAHGLRHAILYLAFPDLYEPNISNRNKQKIADFYTEKLGIEPSGDVDADLLQIRQKVAPEFDKEDGEPFHFYDPPANEWRVVRKPSRKRAVREAPEPIQQDRPGESDRTVTQILNLLQSTHNIILYGPPGTGKTYMGKKAARARIQDQLQKVLSRTAALQRVIEGLTFYEILALTLFQTDPGQTFSVPEIANIELMRARFRTNPVKSPNANIWSNLQSHTDPDDPNVGVSRRAPPYLFSKTAEGGWYLSDEGREYVRESLGPNLEMMHATASETARQEDFIRFTTFHQSYAYEDFIEGLRPITNPDEPGQIGYEIVSGVFRQIADRAAADPDNDYILIIDEINRGNIAKIMGELITLIEDDKRAGNDGALPATLPYSRDAFIVPNNLYIIGTMNTADRSIALLDVALRRRFAFLEIMPDSGLLADAAIETEEGTLPLDALLRKLNAFVTEHVDRDHQVGHSYFMGFEELDPDAQIDKLEYVWNHQILPLLEEYFYSKREVLAELLAGLYGQDEEIGDGLEHLEGEDLLAALIQFAGD